MYHIYTALTKAFFSFFLNIFSTLPVSPFALVCQTYDFQIITIYYLESKSHSVIGPWIGEINIQNNNQNIFKISAIFGDFSISREMYSLAMPDSMYVFILMHAMYFWCLFTIDKFKLALETDTKFQFVLHSTAIWQRFSSICTNDLYKKEICMYSLFKMCINV